ncbi:MAG: hypothetical protein WCX46_03845 [Candidatus Paceibacterota bacterium]
MIRIKTMKINGTIDIHPDGDIFIGDPKDKKMYYAGSITDKDLDENGLVVSVGGKFIKEFIKNLKRIEVK